MYKHYALIKDGVVLDYPVDPRKYIPETNTFNIHEYWEGGELDGNTYMFCHNLEPQHGFDETVIETTPEFNVEKGLWFRKYNIVKLDAETYAARKKMAQQSAEDLMAQLRQELAQMQGTIAALSETKRNEWGVYAEEIEAIPAQPKYPFEYTVPTRPDKAQNLRIGVARI